ncbi:MAG TPA: hypothetical protein VGG18_15905 [Granulicella sp.]
MKLKVHFGLCDGREHAEADTGEALGLGPQAPSPLQAEGGRASPDTHLSRAKNARRRWGTRHCRLREQPAGLSTPHDDKAIMLRSR